MTAPEPQTWKWGTREPDPVPGWEYETIQEFGFAGYRRIYTRPVIQHTSDSTATTQPIGYVFTDTMTMQPPTGQRFASRVQAAVARDVWEARYGFKGRFVVCALVPAEEDQ